MQAAQTQVRNEYGDLAVLWRDRSLISFYIESGTKVLTVERVKGMPLQLSYEITETAKKYAVLAEGKMSLNFAELASIAQEFGFIGIRDAIWCGLEY